jgi:AraC-like DNA-binding protein
LIPPGALHHLKAHGDMAFVYLDAVSDEHGAIGGADLRAAAQALRGAPRSDDAPWCADRLCGLLNLPRRPALDPRIAGILRAIDARPEGGAKLADIARAAGLSPSRCREMIRDAAGLPLRRYRLWRRMARIAEELSLGRSLTEAAYASGFASSAHLSTAFRAMFGLAPSALLKAGVTFDIG